MVAYGLFAATIAPILFFISIIKAPKGTFTQNEFAGKSVTNYRWLFWGNPVLAAFRWSGFIYSIVYNAFRSL